MKQVQRTRISCIHSVYIRCKINVLLIVSLFLVSDCKLLPLWFDLGFSYDEIKAQAFLFFLGASGTTSATLSFLLYNLATHQDCQDKVYEEITRVMMDYVSRSKVKDVTGAMTDFSK